MDRTKPEDSTITMMKDMVWRLSKHSKYENIKQNQPGEIIEIHQTATRRGVGKMLRFFHLLYIIPFLFIPVFSASGSIKTVETSSLIQVNDNLLTVKVRDIPLKKVLMEIAKQKQIKFDFNASADDTLITNFSSLPIEKGLKKLLRDYNYTFIYDSEKSKGGEHEIKKVVILSNTGGSWNNRMKPTIVYREEPHLYDEPSDEDMDYEDSKVMYEKELDYQKSEDVYDDDQNYQEGEDVYSEHSGYNEDEVTYLEDMDPLEREELGVLEGEDVYNENSDIEPMTATTGGTALEPLGEVPYDEEMDVRNEKMEFDMIRNELQDEEAGVRLGAVEVLGVIGGDKAIQSLESALADDDEAVRELAAEELRRLKAKG